jgi:4-diphosphocytidyl-2-C-methyl-D-erythritol kinase
MPVKTLTIQAPAKVNLILRVLSKRPDGYHEIDSLMVPVALFDSLTIETASEGIIVDCPGHPDLCGPQNLAYRAAESFLKETGARPGVKIVIEKRIPLQSGLGGGSSNAAAVLLGMQQLTGQSLKEEALLKLAPGLGADVPFFLEEGPCRCHGLGEIVEPVENIESFWVVLACAPFGFSTAEVYSRLKMALTKPTGGDTQVSPISAWGFELLASRLHNDLQTIGEEMQPVVGKVCDELLEAGAAGASMTGSGPTVFGLCRSEDRAEATLAGVEKRAGWKYLVAKGLTTRTTLRNNAT